MLQLHKISQIVNSMNKAEKRQFSLYSTMQKGEKGYLYLYESVEAGKDLNDIYKLFCRKYGKKSFEPSAKYLYNQLLNVLSGMNSKDNIQSEIFRLINRSTVLYERKLIKEALEELTKAKRLAKHYEQDVLLLLIRRTELKYISENDFLGLNEKQLVGKQMQINECMKYTRSTNLHISLYTTLNFRLNTLGKIRSKKQKDLMNDLVLSELNLVANNYYKGFESTKLHLLFQASYYLNTGSYKSAIRYYSELLDLFNEHDHLKQNPPIYYFTTLEGIINSLFIAGIYNEVPFFIDKLRILEKGDYPTDFLLKVKWRIFSSQAELLIRTANFTEALALIHANEEELFKKTHLLNLEAQLKLYLHALIIFLYNNDLKNARRAMRKINQEAKLFQVFPVYRAARLLNLIINVEMEEYDLLENEIRSIKRAIRQESQAYKTESLVFKYVMMHPIPKYAKMRNILWKKLEKEIIEIRGDKYEQQLLHTFDFLAWIECKVKL